MKALPGVDGAIARGQTLRMSPIVPPKPLRSHGITLVDFADQKRAHADELRRYEDTLGIVHPDFRLQNSLPHWWSENDPHLNVVGNMELARRVLDGLRATGKCLPALGR